MVRLQRWFFSIAVCISSIFFTIPVQANISHSTLVQEVTTSYEFGRQVTFHATLDDGKGIQNINLFIHPEGQNTSIHNVDIKGNEIQYRYDVRQSPIRAFAVVDYWYSFTKENGEVNKSEKYSFSYEDNRFEWQQIEEDNLTIYWVDENEAFGKKVLGISQEGIISAQKYLPVELNRQINIFLYPTQDDLKSAVQLGQLSWIAGHASPDLGIILISAVKETDLSSELERQIPHELMHILQYQVSGDAYEQLPEWLIEGMASLAELNPNIEYDVALENALADKNLHSMTSLCDVFPEDKNKAFLAYAQSESFVRFLYNEYGAEGLQRLIDQYSGDDNCSNGIQSAFSVTLTQMENRWLKEHQGENQYYNALVNLAPYSLLLLIITILPVAPLIFFKPGKKQQNTINGA